MTSVWSVLFSLLQASVVHYPLKFTDTCLRADRVIWASAATTNDAFSCTVVNEEQECFKALKKRLQVDSMTWYKPFYTGGGFFRLKRNLTFSSVLYRCTLWVNRNRISWSNHLAASQPVVWSCLIVLWSYFWCCGTFWLRAKGQVVWGWDVISSLQCLALYSGSVPGIIIKLQLGRCNWFTWLTVGEWGVNRL